MNAAALLAKNHMCSGAICRVMTLVLVATLLVGCRTQQPNQLSIMLTELSSSIVAVGHNGSTIGSAFALAPGYFVTSHHIAARAPIYLLDQGGKPVAAKLVAGDTKRDTAILQANLRVPSLRPAASANIGSTVYALGNPFGLGLTVTHGIVSAYPKSIQKSGLLQIDAAVNPGNSGGPIVNSAGHVVGLVSSRAAIGSGIAFAVPTEQLLTLLASVSPNETASSR